MILIDEWQLWKECSMKWIRSDSDEKEHVISGEEHVILGWADVYSEFII